MDDGCRPQVCGSRYCDGISGGRVVRERRGALFLSWSLSRGATERDATHKVEKKEHASVFMVLSTGRTGFVGGMGVNGDQQDAFHNTTLKLIFLDLHCILFLTGALDTRRLLVCKHSHIHIYVYLFMYVCIHFRTVFGIEYTQLPKVLFVLTTTVLLLLICYNKA